jgi:hypothetical protein
MTRRLNEGIIQAICKYAEETEVPSIFALWSGIAAISAMLGRRCSIDYGHISVFPNLYIVLVAGSARCRKSTAINICDKFIRKVSNPPNMLSQKMTPEALIEALSSGNKMEEGNVILQAEGIAVVDELSTLIDKNAFKSGMIALLTRLYDCEDFEYRTRGKGIEKICNPCLTVYGGSTMEWIKEAIPKPAIGGGFTSRVVFVYLAKRERNIAWPFMSTENIKRIDDIVHDLSSISDMRGLFNITKDAKELFEYEYERFNNESDLIDSPGLSGYAGRRHMTLLKISTVISASRTDEREINKGDITVAINALERAEVSMPRVIRAIGATDTGELTEIVLNTIMKKRIINRSDLIKLLRHKITVMELDAILVGLLECKYVIRDTSKGMIRYAYNKE